MSATSFQSTLLVIAGMFGKNLGRNASSFLGTELTDRSYELLARRGLHCRSPRHPECAFSPSAVLYMAGEARSAQSVELLSSIVLRFNPTFCDLFQHNPTPCNSTSVVGVSPNNCSRSWIWPANLPSSRPSSSPSFRSEGVGSLFSELLTLWSTGSS